MSIFPYNIQDMLKNRPTVMEVNKYIEPVVANLLSEYNKVTHPEFDNALREITGIGWKQTKNYKNHSDPTSVLPGNSKVIKFIYASRKKDKWFRLKRFLVNTFAITMVLSVIFMIKNNIQMDREEYEKKLHTLIEKRLRQTMGVEGLTGCVKKSKQLIECSTGKYFLKFEKNKDL